MTRDPRDKEEEFIAGLAEDTGRDLRQWMALIDARTFGHRNEMIDWLRQQGLTFAKASRLERIHHNGGKPMYGEKVPPRVAPESRISPDHGRPPADQPAQTEEPSLEAQPPPQDAAAVHAPAAPVPSPAPVAVHVPAVVHAGVPTGDLPAFLARAKGYRPLAELLIRSIRAAIPATTINVHDSHADLAAPAIYGAIALTAKDVRLALDLGEHPFDTDIKRLRLPGVGPALTHTIVLNDARKVDSALLKLVAAAAARANT